MAKKDGKYRIEGGEMDNKVIPVVFATDDNYVPYCGVAITSLIANTNRDKNYVVYIMYDKLSSMSIYRLESLTCSNVKVKCINIHSYIQNLKVVEYNHLTIASAYRLIIPELFTQYDKIIYLDSDIVVNRDIAEMYDIEIKDNILGACHGYYREDDDMWMCNHITKTLGISLESFFNAGILIINCKQFIQNRVKEKCFDLLSTRKDLIFMDQCALNIVCKGKVKMICSCWNYEWMFLFSNNDEEIQLMDNPAIIHYDGISKPWDRPNMVLANVFWKYARSSDFYEEILYKAQINNMRALLDVLGVSEQYKNVAIYGAGNIGKQYVDKILQLNLINIVTWVDKNYQDKKDTRFPVSSIETLYTSNYDHLIIALGNREIAMSVKEMLVSNGIREEKIVFIK